MGVANATQIGPRSLLVGARTDYVCDPGFVLEGSRLIWCQSNGQWTPSPHCVPGEYCKMTVFLSWIGYLPIWLLG